MKSSTVVLITPSLDMLMRDAQPHLLDTDRGFVQMQPCRSQTAFRLRKAIDLAAVQWIPRANTLRNGDMLTDEPFDT